MDLLVCFGALFSCRSQVCFSLRSRTDVWALSFRITQNLWFHLTEQALQVLQQRSAPDYPASTMFVPFYMWWDTHLPRSSTCVSVHKILHLEDHQDAFWQSWEEPLCSFSSEVVWSWQTSQQASLGQSVSNGGIMNSDQLGQLWQPSLMSPTGLWRAAWKFGLQDAAILSLEPEGNQIWIRGRSWRSKGRV